MPQLPTNQPVIDNPVSPDYEKWKIEKDFRAREIRIKEREQSAKEEELELKKKDQASFQWRSPLVLSIIAAAAAAGGNAVVANLNGTFERQLERQKSEESRILEMIKTGDPDNAAENLRFLLDAGLITAVDTREKLSAFLAKRKAGSGPTLPSPTDAKGLINGLEFGDSRGVDVWLEKGNKIADELGVKTNLGRALLTAEMMSSGEPRVRNIIKATAAIVGGSPAGGVDEKKWIAEYLNQMQKIGGYPKELIQRRMQQFKPLVAKGDWDLRSNPEPSIR